MKSKIAVIAFIIIGQFFLNVFHITAQTSAPTGIFSDSVYQSIKIDSNIVYGNNFNPFTNQTDTLKLDTYQPDSIVDYLRPVVIYCHGGGFTGGDKSKDKAVAFGNYFAKFGYLFASINYRLYIDDPLDTIDNFQGVYMCTQDAKAAVRFFRRYASDYCVDTSSIFMIGTSAGGAIALTSAYWQQNEADAVFNTTEFGYLDSATGNPGYSSHLTAIISCWGGLTDTAWLENETTPNQLFHGTNDPVVPYTHGLSANGVYLYGSYDIHQASLNNNLESYLHPFVGAGHGVGVSTPQFDTLLQISTPFLFNHLNIGEGQTACGFPASFFSLPVEKDLVMHQLSDGSISFQNLSDKSIEGWMKFYSLSGAVVQAMKFDLSVRCTKQIDCSYLANDCYLVELQSNELHKVFKAVVLNGVK